MSLRRPVLLSTFLRNPPYRGKHAQRDRAADAIYEKLLAEGVDPKKARSRSFAIATKQLQRFGYLKPGTATPTARGAGKIGAIMRRNPDAVAGLTATIEAIQRNWTDVVSRASLTGQLLAGIKAARKEIAVSFDKKTLRQIVKVAVELLNKLRGRSGTMKKNPRKHTVRRNPKTYTGNFYVPFGTSYLFVDLEYRGKLLHTYKGTSSLDVPELKQKCRTFAENQKATVKFKGLKELGIKENPRKRALKRNGAGRVTHNGHVITIHNSVYTVQPYKKAFSGPDGFVRAKKWIDAHVLRESGQGWKLKKNPGSVTSMVERLRALRGEDVVATLRQIALENGATVRGSATKVRVTMSGSPSQVGRIRRAFMAAFPELLDDRAGDLTFAFGSIPWKLKTTVKGGAVTIDLEASGSPVKDNPRRRKATRRRVTRRNPRRFSTDYHATTTVSGVKTEEAWFEDPLFGTQSVAEMAIDMSRRAPKGAKIVIRGAGKTWTFEVVSPGSVKRAVKKNPRRRNPVTDVLRESGQGWRLRRNPGSCQEDPHSFWFGTPVLVRGMPGLFVRHGKGENEGKVEITIDGVKRWVNSGIVTHPTGPFGSNFVMKLNGRQKNPRRRNPKRSNPRYLTREEFDKRYWPKTKETPEGAAGVPYSVRKEFYADYRNSGLGFAAYKRSTTESFRDY